MCRPVLRGLRANVKAGIDGTVICTGSKVVIPAKAGIQPTEQLMRMKQYWVYMCASDRNGTLYIGVTGDLIRRMAEHKEKVVKGFTKKYGVSRLVYYETHESIESAIIRETQMKKWNRLWKLRVIEEMNPEWHDLFDEIYA